MIWGTPEKGGVRLIALNRPPMHLPVDGSYVRMGGLLEEFLWPSWVLAAPKKRHESLDEGIHLAPTGFLGICETTPWALRCNYFGVLNFLSVLPSA